MQQRCPIENCGRMFQNQLTMLEHVKRRHPQQSEKIRQQTTNEMLEKQNRISEEMNKLPKMQKVIQMSKDKKPLEFQRRSSSKKRIELSNIIENSHGKMSQIISDSRQLVDQNSSSRKLLKRPSLSKKSSEQQESKLPSLGHSKIKKLKLQSLKSQVNSSTISRQSNMLSRQSNMQRQKMSVKNESLLQTQSQSMMYSTAPNFSQQMNKKIQLIRSRGNKDGEMSNRSSSKDVKEDRIELGIKKRLSSQMVDQLMESQKTKSQKTMSLKTSEAGGSGKPMQRPSMKKLLERSTKKDSSHSLLVTKQDLTQSTFIQKSQLIVQPKKQFTFQPKKRPLSKQDQSFHKKQFNQSFHKMQSDQAFHKKQPSPAISSIIQPKIISNPQLMELNWQQRTVTITKNQVQNLIIPDYAQVQYLYATGCGIQVVDLNECFSLITLTLTHNHIDSLAFLQQTLNGAYQNLQELYLDHNLLSSLNTLPTYLQLHKLSLSFNKISGLDHLLKVLLKFPMLQQLDLSFNPVRKQTNYKLAVLAACRQLKKLDGMVVTKFDREMSAEYHKMYLDYLHIIPLSSSPISEDKFRPSTAVSINYQQEFEPENGLNEMTEEQLAKEIEILQKMIKNTKDQFEIIQEENNALEEEIESYEVDLTHNEKKQEEFNPKVYKKLCKEVQELEMLNFLQYASQKELQQIIYKKITENGLSMELLTAN